jgi:hypothetical protein
VKQVDIEVIVGLRRYSSYIVIIFATKNIRAMTEEFKRQFDYNVKVMEAASLAATLGYEEGYYGNLMCENVDYCNRLRAAIRKLVGNEWPERVKKAYSEHYDEGYMDS